MPAIFKCDNLLMGESVMRNIVIYSTKKTSEFAEIVAGIEDVDVRIEDTKI